MSNAPSSSTTRDESVRIQFAPDVRDHDGSATTNRPNLGCNLLKLRPRNQRDIRADGSERYGCRTADAASSTCHERDLTVEAE